MNLYMTASQLKMKHVPMQTMWGPNHLAVQAMTTHINQCCHHHKILLRYCPQAVYHQNLTPVLIAQQWRKAFNIWVLDQQESTSAVPFYTDILNSM
jgi:hypothetical protein